MKYILFLVIVLIQVHVFGQDKDPTIYSVAQQMPEYPGGEDSMWRFIHAQIRYPDSAAAHNIQGRVIMGFVVNEDGSISDIAVKKGLSPDLDREAERVVKLLPHFNPGIQDGKTVKVSYILPLTFKLKIDSTRKPNIEKKAEFPGGPNAMVNFIQKNVNYPERERDNDIQGRVVIHFTVNEDGSLSDFKVKDAVSPGIDAEALRVAKMLPTFQPASRDGKPVKADFYFPIAFKLATDDYSQYSSRYQYPKPDYTHMANLCEKPDAMPLFVGGKDKMMEFISHNIKYPWQAEMYNVEGTITVTFVVNEDGRLTDFGVLKYGDEFLIKESLRVAKLMPPFKPGTKDGKPVKTMYSLPIGFKLSESKLDTAKLDKYPQFPGGDTAEVRFMNQNIKYPQVARDSSIQGKVILAFIVSEDGSLSDFRIIKSVQKDLDAEAMRVAKLLPKFKPGMRAGKAVKAVFEFPVNFKIG